MKKIVFILLIFCSYQKWKEWNEKEKEDPEWGEKHPLVFDVRKEDGEIQVRV